MSFWIEFMVDARELVRSLRQHELRCRTGILSLATGALGTESQIAAALGIEHLDYVDRLKALVPADSKFVNVNLPRLMEDLDALANAMTGETCVLVANFDLAVAGLKTDEVRALWQALLTDFPHRTRAILFCVPGHAEGSFSFPDSRILALWRESGRFAEWNHG
jgi:hypothetical protein